MRLMRKYKTGREWTPTLQLPRSFSTAKKLPGAGKIGSALLCEFGVECQMNIFVD